MKLVVLYRRESEYGRSVEEYLHDFQRRYPELPVEVKDIDSTDGIATMELYDITNPPAFLALRPDGSVLNSWQGSVLPLMEELASTQKTE